MEAAKPWYLSRTIWASIIVVASAGAGILGFPLDDAETASLTDAVLQSVTAIAGVVAIAGRVAARNLIR
ncbi:hypothetical protein [Mesorhizobium sp. CAU 1741]|uniref:hypothetical protein n=1 Tax=Mesorhizobium sp. CAU 1741 TaxID=3140366 RepID=UPI00325C1673